MSGNLTQDDEFPAAARLKEKWPEPPGSPRQRLQHVLDVYWDQDDSKMAIEATHGVYGPREGTGITWGDLRVIMEQIPADELEKN